MLPRIPKFKKGKLKTAVQLLFVLAAVFLFLTTVNSVWAAPGDVQEQQTSVSFGLQTVQQNIALGSTDIRLIIAKIIRVVLSFLGIIAICLVIYAGYTIMTSEGNEEKISEGKKILTNAVIGLLIVLSAFAIAQFIINALARATGMMGGPEQINLVKREYFYGSGSLGKIVKDHYPGRDQTDVARNTSISVTFAEPIDPASIIENTNQTCWPKDGSDQPISKSQNDGADCATDAKSNILEYYGDCLGSGASRVCDQLIYNSVDNDTTKLPILIYAATTTAESKLAKTDFIPRLAATRYQDGNKHNAYSFTFRPLPPTAERNYYLGSDQEDIWYNVKLTNNIKRLQLQNNKQVGVFDPQPVNKYYLWKFETGTNFDFIPPYVSAVKPKAVQSIPRNQIIRVDFSEAVDPVSAQGVLDPDSGFTNMIFGTTTVTGEWRLSNGYRSAEFIPADSCGYNSCGELMYCLPVNCKPPVTENCTEDYEILVRTAELTGATTSFEGDPFTGITDECSNALDNGLGMKPDFKIADPHKPTPGINGDLKKFNTSTEEHFDNYWWNFKVRNYIDRTRPVIQKVYPLIDKEEVAYNEPWEMYFNKEMLYYSFNNIILDQYCQGANCPAEATWFVPRFDTVTSTLTQWATLVNLRHGEFGPKVNNERPDVYYFPVLPSTVKSDNQQCLYPGRGPISDVGDKGAYHVCNYQENSNGQLISGTDAHCIPVLEDERYDTGCAQTSEDTLWAQANVQACTSSLENDSISPFFAPIL